MSRPLCVLTPEIGVLSETFIHWDIDNLLPGRTAVISDPPPNGETARGDRAWTTSAPTLEFPPVPGDPPPSRASQDAARRFLGEHGVEVVLVEYLDFADRWFDLLRELPVRVWLRGHGVDLSARLRQQQWRHAYRRFAEADGIMVPSRITADRLTALDIPSSRVHVVPNHIDVPRQPPAARAPERRLQCLSVGRLVPKKGHRWLLEAVRLAVEAGRDLNLDLIGAGPLRNELERRVNDAGLQARVRFLGPRSHREVLQHLRRADVLLHHAVTAPDGDAEGLPLAILEALAACVPVVATAHDGISEVLTDKSNARVTAERDPAAMADALMSLIDNPEQSLALARAGWHTAHTNYSNSRWRPAKLDMLGLTDGGSTITAPIQ